MSATATNWRVITADKLVAGNYDLLVSELVDIAEGQNLPRGAVLGRCALSGDYALSHAAAADGSQDPDAVLAEACDTTHGKAKARIYIRGDFIVEHITLGKGHTLDRVKARLRLKGIYLIKSE